MSLERLNYTLHSVRGLAHVEISIELHMTFIERYRSRRNKQKSGSEWIWVDCPYKIFRKITKIWRFVKLKVNILVVIGTDCTDRCKSNYHTITTTTAPNTNMKSLNSNTKCKARIILNENCLIYRLNFSTDLSVYVYIFFPLNNIFESHILFFF